MKSTTVKANNPHSGMGAGRFRQPWRIREYLDSLGLTMQHVAEKTGVSRVVVSETIRGNRNNRKVLKCLDEIGCPRQFLSLPDDMA